VKGGTWGNPGTLVVGGLVGGGGQWDYLKKKVKGQEIQSARTDNRVHAKED